MVADTNRTQTSPATIGAEIGRVLLLSTVDIQQRGSQGKWKSGNGRRVVADTDGQLPALMADKREKRTGRRRNLRK
ncbi:hypothetical protein L484_000501 [Morus notabilis]|uniref:Uncharacterized protein n=1 Tax=Morus notabilis TaxID=981085 RepID=W9SLU1_9ROSA|nr:hypothetical protein L484_000501 [Morus notabilis]